MGGVPALLLVIAAGITYGWQPDREGGVEYIIQVPPDQVERLAQIGEISSVIDPEVRGHVSRVVIRVGTGPIPKNTPANLSDRAAATRAFRSSDLAILDASPVPIPEMTDGNAPEPIPGFHHQPLDGEQSVLKPDANSPQGTPGYGFPTPPTSLQSTPTTQIDQAGREIRPPASPANSIFGPSIQNPSTTAPSSSAIRIPPPATRTAPPTSVATPPPFTGSDPQGDYARARAGGPSTDPTNVRDSTWRDFPPPPSSSNAGQTAASPSPENPFQTSNTNRPATPGSNGLAPGDTYGKLPSGFSFVGGGDGASGGAPSGTAATNAYGATNYGVSSNGYGSSSATNSSSPGSNTTSAAGPDPRLTAVQVAAGAWSIDDASGRLLDRQGRVMNAMSWGSTSAAATSPGPIATTNNQMPGPNSSFGSGTGYGSNSGYSGGFPVLGANGGVSPAPFNSSLGPPSTQGAGGFTPPTNNSIAFDRNQPLTRLGSSEFEAISSSAESQRGFDVRGTVRPTSTTSTVESTTREAYVERRDDPPSLSERQASSGLPPGEGAREVVAPQPLFNGLLLISLVANVYLIFWLKNLRIQFRELVAAKRMAASSSSQ